MWGSPGSDLARSSSNLGVQSRETAFAELFLIYRCRCFKSLKITSLGSASVLEGSDRKQQGQEEA